MTDGDYCIFSEYWRKENNLQQNVSSLKEELSRADHSLRSMAGKVRLGIIMIVCMLQNDP